MCLCVRRNVPFFTSCCCTLLLFQDVKKSRLAYMAAKMLACANPLELLCIAIDGADQSAFATPYFCQETKDSVKGWKMRMKLIGALVSGRMCMFYTLGSNWESGEPSATGP